MNATTQTVTMRQRDGSKGVEVGDIIPPQGNEPSAKVVSVKRVKRVSERVQGWG